jgi:trypsin
MYKSLRLPAALTLVSAVTLVGTPSAAQAVTGGTATSDIAVQRLEIGSFTSGTHPLACSGVKVAREWVMTTATCLRAGGAAPATNGSAPAKPVSITEFAYDGQGRPVAAGGIAVEAVALHPTRDVALLSYDDKMRNIVLDPADPSNAKLASSAPTAGDAEVQVVGYGRTADEWAPATPHQAGFQVRTVTDSTLDMSAVTDAGVCMGDAGAPVVADAGDGSAEVIALAATGTQGGCLGSGATGHEASAIRVDGLDQWVKSWTLATSFEATDPTVFANTPAPGGANAVTNIGGVCCSLTGPELGVRTERAKTGARSMLYSGKDNSATKSFAYLKAYDAPGVLVTKRTLLRYAIWPEGAGTHATGTNSTCVAVDLDFSDGTHLRDLKALASNNVDAHPAKQCGHLTVNTWNEITVPVGKVAAGKKIVRVNVGYDQAAKTGGYRGFVDDIFVYHGCLAAPGQACGF